ncbi:hypothetical protein GW17_00009737 [Ensete ventricosum]|nr:hypothetical protein GW17_00009737 [Ensete ventricosum]
MKCFQFRNESTKGEFQARLSASVRSNSTTSTERDMRRSGSEFNSGDVTDSGTDSVGRPQYPSFSQRPINLRVFTFSELRNATKNFSRSLMVGEGGFGCVYRGTIKSLDDPDTKTEIAIKQLNRKGLQASYGVFLYVLITGRQPIDKNRPKGEQKLLEWVRPYISDVKKIRIIMDPKLEGDYSLKSASKLVTVANRCLVRQPKSRPKMSDVLDMVQQIIESTETGAPEAPLRSCSEEGRPGEAKKKGLKRTIGDWKIGENMRLLWQGWKAKLVRTC